jgi:hypothetical protein
MSTVLVDDPAVSARRAIEALRAGVPSADAIEVLGSAQPEAGSQVRRQWAAC